MSSPKFSVNYLQDKEDISEEKMLNKFSSSPLLFQKKPGENKLNSLIVLNFKD